MAKFLSKCKYLSLFSVCLGKSKISDILPTSLFVPHCPHDYVTTIRVRCADHITLESWFFSSLQAIDSSPLAYNYFNPTRVHYRFCFKGHYYYTPLLATLQIVPETRTVISSTLKDVAPEQQPCKQQSARSRQYGIWDLDINIASGMHAQIIPATKIPSCRSGVRWAGSLNVLFCSPFSHPEWGSCWRRERRRRKGRLFIEKKKNKKTDPQ